MTLKSRLGVTHDVNLCTIVHRWNQQTRDYLFANDSMDLSSSASTNWAPEQAI